MKRLLILFCAVLACGHLAADGIISTVAGASTVDGVAATSTLLNYPGGVASDGVGNIYISDTSNQRIRRVDASTHIISTVAGTGVAGYSGDNGLATQAQFNNPNGISYVIVGGDSCLYVADSGNQRIRRIDLSTGIITTVAGTGVATYNGNDDGNLAIQASLNNPLGVYATSSGSFYIADTSNNRIRFVNASSQDITTVAGNGIAGFGGDTYQALSANVELNAPQTCIIGPGGNLYIADTNNFRVRMVNLSTGILTTVAGSGSYGYSNPGLATSASFTYIRGLYADPNYVFISDSLNNRIRYLTGSYVYDWFGTGAAGYSGDGGYYTSAVINNPGAMTVDSFYNNVFVDYSNNCVRRVDDSSTYFISTIAGSGIQDNVPGVNVVLKDPERVIAGATNQVLIAEKGANKVRSLDIGTGIISTFAGTGASVYSGDGGAATDANFWGVHALARDASGNVYVADNYSTLGITYTYTCFGSPPFGFCFNLPTGTYTYGESRIRKIDSLGNITTVAGTSQLNYSPVTQAYYSAKLGLVHGLALSGNNLYLSDSYFQVLRRMDLSNGQIYAYGGVSATAGYSGDGSQISSGSVEFNNPQGLATDSFGNLYIADTDNNAVRRVSASSLSITTLCGLGPTHAGYSGDGGQANLAALFAPSGVYVDSQNNIFIADTGNSRIRRIDALSNSITTVVGNGFQGFSGDGGEALTSELDGPASTYVDASNNIYVADAGNNRIRKVDFAPSPTLTPVVAGAGKVAAFPSPANDRICFSYTAPQAGPVEITVYNTALQLVAKFDDTVAAGTALTCANVSGLASGVYLYRMSVPGGSFSPNKFKVIH